MIPFEREPSLNRTEERVEELLESRWTHVVRSTPGIREDLEARYPRLSEEVSRQILEDVGSELSQIFRPGVPDFLAFDDTGEYLFVEAKSGDDGMRHTQLRWLRDFRGVNLEVWFAEKEREIERLEGSELESYGFRDLGREDGSTVKQQGGRLSVELPEELAAVVGVEEGSEVKWRLKSGDELVLDAR
ncbi:MAG: VRR-NUC domain-containing protein [Candidatus Nanohaloarchaea archaeon]